MDLNPLAEQMDPHTRVESKQQLGDENEQLLRSKSAQDASPQGPEENTQPPHTAHTDEGIKKRLIALLKAADLNTLTGTVHGRLIVHVQRRPAAAKTS
jgi:hypothetical protein